MPHRSLYSAGTLLALSSMLVALPSGAHAQVAQGTDGQPAASFGQPPAAGTMFLHPERFEKQDGTLGWVERGQLFVPVNRADPASRVISVEVWRFRADPEADPDTPPIFRLHGGPGWPGLAGSLESDGYYEAQVAPFTRMADLVVVGQRGIGSSKPDTACEAPRPDTGLAEMSETEQVQLIQSASRRCAEFWQEHGLDLAGFTVLEAAADVADVRRAFGYDTITIWGGSFGSHWGMTVLRNYPEIVARAVLTGMEGPDHTYDDPAGILKVYERIAADAEDSHQLADLIPEAGLIAALRETIRRLDADPVTITVSGEGQESADVELDGDAIRSLADGYYLGRVGERRREASWPAGILALHEGDYERAARRVLQSSTIGSLPTASFFMLDCGSGITAERDQRFVNDAARDLVGDQSFFYRAACPAWDADLGDDFRQNFDTRVPTVIVHGTWDISTPFENAVELAPHFKQSRFVVVERGSHGALGEALEESPSFRESLMEFVATGDMTSIPERVELPEPDWVVPEGP